MFDFGIVRCACYGGKHRYRGSRAPKLWMVFFKDGSVKTFARKEESR